MKMSWNRIALAVATLAALAALSAPAVEAGSYRLTADIDERPAVACTDARSDDIPVLWLTGHAWPTFTDEDIEALKRYLAGGGFVVATPACGRAAFNARFPSFGSPNSSG